MKIAGATWFTMFGGKLLGIVYGETPEGVRKAYLGTAPNEGEQPGLGSPDEAGDAQFIAENGAKVMPAELRRLADYLEGGK